VDSSGSEEGPVVGSCKHGNEGKSKKGKGKVVPALN
jgi:hypothetical protein